MPTGPDPTRARVLEEAHVELDCDRTLVAEEVERLRETLGVATRVQLVAWALRGESAVGGG